jgi:F0F1-type ATP synthase assembly protein I
MRRKRRKKDNQAIFRALRVFGAVGFNLAAAMLIGFFLGRFLDRLLASDPWFAVLGFLLGAIGGFLQLWRQAIGEVERDDWK